MKQKLLALVIAVLLFPAIAIARNYDISIKDASPEAAMQTIKKATSYEFVYNKSILSGLSNKRLNGEYHDMSIEQILNRVVNQQMGLDFEIIDHTIVLSKPTEQKVLKSLISGQVLDESGEPLSGATVTVFGTDAIVATDLNGQFFINVEGKSPYIEVSYVGMHPKSIKVKESERYYVITLESDPTLMNEVVVTGYQNLKRENATGSYQTITSQDMDRSFTSSVTDRLEGKVPGLVTYDNGDGQKISIRGIGSFRANTQPLIVVDGLPIEGGIETVNPYDIENITILKDAAAASIYGARAANGVIVITTKRAKSEKVTIDFNTDITITEKNNYDNYGWATAAEVIELEKYNFEYMKSRPDQAAINSLVSSYNTSKSRMPSVIRYLIGNYVGDISDAVLNSKLNEYASNDYRQEYLDNFTRSRVQQQYNLALRTQGKSLSSSIVLNYAHDNLGEVGNNTSAITFKYRGDLKLSSRFDVVIGANVISERGKSHYGRPTINSYSPIRSMFNPDGSLADMTEGVYDELPAMSNPDYGLKSMWYNPLKEINMNPIDSRRTNIRTYLQGTFKILPGWTATAMFQYEDIYFKRNTLREGESSSMRTLYNYYTGIAAGTSDVVEHYIPDGGRLDQYTSEGAYWTFRAQTQYHRTIFEKHNIDAIAGFEYRDSHDNTSNNVLLGYDDQTQTNQNGSVNFKTLAEQNSKASVLGADYKMSGAPSGMDFTTTDILHRFYSVYFNANYTYDTRYSISGSWRIDKTDLFGADPKFRGRPLWSVGASWNAHNETFLRDYTWIDALKPRISYGLTGNIDSSVSSYLVAKITTNSFIGNNYASLQNPPNDQLRWEKTQTWNVGIDFSFLRYRISGSFDYYHKKGSDLLCSTDIDPTNGVTSVTINNGECVNHGIELQLNGHILEATNRNQLGINAYLNLAFNKNEITYVNKAPLSGLDALMAGRLHQGYPINSLFSYDFAGIEVKNEKQYVTWRDHEGNVQNSSVLLKTFTPEDIVYGGSLDPKFVGTFTPEITWQGFSLSAMMVYYGGHVMRVNSDDNTADGSQNGYATTSQVKAVPSSYLNYWRTGDDTKYFGNGYASKSIMGNAASFTRYGSNNVAPADYFKLRNIVLSYTFPNQLTRRIGVNQARLRFQMTNVATWVRNDAGKDPEAVIAFTGVNRDKAPRQYTFSLFLNF